VLFVIYVAKLLSIPGLRPSIFKLDGAARFL
jgi:hypothetical protein